MSAGILVGGENMGRAPYGARGLKFYSIGGWKTRISRAPYGARGLKCVSMDEYFGIEKVVPRTGHVD